MQKEKLTKWWPTRLVKHIDDFDGAIILCDAMGYSKHAYTQVIKIEQDDPFATVLADWLIKNWPKECPS